MFTLLTFLFVKSEYVLKKKGRQKEDIFVTLHFSERILKMMYIIKTRHKYYGSVDLLSHFTKVKCDSWT